MPVFVDLKTYPVSSTTHVIGRGAGLRTAEGAAASTAPVRAAPAPKPDWSQLSTIQANLEQPAPAWGAVIGGFSEQDRRHVATLLALTHEQRVALAQQGQMSTRMGNAGWQLISQQRWAESLVVYDAALLGPIAAGACANPLYAVQNDNNHLGVDERRARFYLEKCLPHAPANPTIYLNAACVMLELGQPDETIRLLTLAKKGGVDVKRFRDDPFFVPIASRPDYQQIFQ